MWRSCAAAVKWISRSMHVGHPGCGRRRCAELVCSCCGVSRPIDARRHPGADSGECGAAVQLL
ncbi:hypothetical protein GQA12_23105 [Paenibacillus alvei]|nr:hypothetical protein [Paenibacillus alvei]